MITIAILYLILGVVLALIGLGSALRYLSYMVRGVAMGWGLIFALVLIGAIGLSIGGILIVTSIVSLVS